MDSDKWLEFTIFTGIDKYKAMLSKLVKDSKKLKNNFDYMRLIATAYLGLERMMDEVQEIL